MKAQRLAMLGAAPLLASVSAHAGFTGITVVSKPNPYGLLVCNVFATFDRPGQDRFMAAAGTPNTPMDISVVGGTFYQDPFGGEKAPSAALVQIHPSLAFDSFVTIGVKMVGAPGGQPLDLLAIAPPGGLGYAWGPSFLGGTDLGWALPLAAAQGDPFNP